MKSTQGNSINRTLVHYRGGVLGVALAAALLFGATAARAEDPATQRDMAASFGEKLGLSVKEAQRRLDLDDRLVGVADQIRKQLGDSYAGIWFDQADGGRMKIGVAAAASDSDTAVVDQVQALLEKNGASEDADLVRVGATQGQLEAEQDRVNAALADDLTAGRVSTALDPTTNAVVVKVATDVPEAGRADIAKATNAVGSEARIESATGKYSFNACVGRSTDHFLFCSNPLRGAVSIGVPSGYCSAGFVVLGNSGGNPWLMTAGHCLYEGGTSTWASRDASLVLHNIGARHSYTLSAAGDYGITDFSTAYWNTSPYVVYDGASTYNETYHIFDAGTSYVGMPICGSGMRLLSNGHYTDCGSVTALNVSATADGVTTQHLGEANLCTGLSGNSGGPEYKDGHGYGLQDGAFSTCDIAYQGLAGALSGSNVHLVG